MADAAAELYAIIVVVVANAAVAHNSVYCHQQSDLNYHFFVHDN